MFKKKEITPEVYVEKLNEALPDSVHSVILFGSAAAGEHAGKRSDYNLLIITESLGLLELNQIAKVTQGWLSAGNPPPLMFTHERLAESADVFPIEMLDMKQFYKVLHGSDILKDVEVDPVHLRLMIEREIRSLRIQLNQGFIFANGNVGKVGDLVISTISTALVLMRATLRLFSKNIPEHRHDVPAALKEFKEFAELDEDAFTTAYKLKRGGMSIKEVSPLELFERYLRGLVLVGDVVNAM